MSYWQSSLYSSMNTVAEEGSMSITTSIDLKNKNKHGQTFELVCELQQFQYTICINLARSTAE